MYTKTTLVKIAMMKIFWSMSQVLYLNCLILHAPNLILCYDFHSICGKTETQGDQELAQGRAPRGCKSWSGAREFSSSLAADPVACALMS